MKRKSEYSEKLRDPRWQKMRLQVMERDRFSCQYCTAEDKTLNVHHLGYNGDPWDVPMSALITLCEDCHEEETASLPDSVATVIKDLKMVGFSSRSFGMLESVFGAKNRNWASFEPNFSVLQMVVEDDELWDQMERLFWERLSERGEKRRLELKEKQDAEQGS